MESVSRSCNGRRSERQVLCVTKDDPRRRISRSCSASRIPCAARAVFLAHAVACSTHTVAPVLILYQNSSAPYPQNPLRDADGEAFIDVSSFILFFSSVFSSFTVSISSSISMSLVLNSSTNLCRFCSISNVVVLVLTAETAAIDDAVGTPTTRDIIEWNGMERNGTEWNGTEWNTAVGINKPKHFNFYRCVLYIITPSCKSWSVPPPVPSPSYSSSQISTVVYSLTVLGASSKNSLRSCRRTISAGMRS